MRYKSTDGHVTMVGAPARRTADREEGLAR